MKRLNNWYDRLPQAPARVVASAISFLAGLAVAIVFHYLLYRFGLPSKPFIYVSF